LPHYLKIQTNRLGLGKSDQISGIGTALLLDQTESSPVREQFYTKVAGKSSSQVKAARSRLVFSGKATPPKELANSADVKKMVAANANAIGYIEKGSCGRVRQSSVNCRVTCPPEQTWRPGMTAIFLRNRLGYAWQHVQLTHH
jgi:hypothetical protein